MAPIHNLAWSVGLFAATLLLVAVIFTLVAGVACLWHYLEKRRQMKDPKSLTYALETGDWSHWSGTELALAYVMNPYIGDLKVQDAIRRELKRRGIRH